MENLAFIMDCFEGDAARAKAPLDKYGLRMANLYQHYSGDDAKDFENAMKYTGFMTGTGVNIMNLQGVMGRTHRMTGRRTRKPLADTPR